MIIVGIDPGLSGAIAFIKGKKVKIYPIPTFKLTKSKKTFDENKIRNYLKKYKVDHVFIEKVSAMPIMGGKQCPVCRRKPSQGVTSSFNFGAGWGLLRGICVGLSLPYTLVTPQAWKKVMCAGMAKGSKDVSIIVAKRIWPKINLLPTSRCRKDSDGMADAVCIAEYGRRLLLGEKR